MATFHVTSPDGATYEINAPDGASDADVMSYAQQQHTPEAPATPPPDSALSRFGQGVMDPMNAGAQMLLHALPDTGVLKGSANYLDNKLGAQEANYHPPEGVDWARMGGNMTATLPLAMGLPGAGATSLAGRAAVGAATGAGFGALTPVTSNQDDFMGQKLKQAGAGALVGGIAAPVTGAVASMVKPNVNPDVQTLIDAGVTPTPGQTLGGFYKSNEDKLTSVPGLGDVIKNAQRRAVEGLNTAVYNRALNPIGEKAGSAVGNEGIDLATNALSSAYQKVLPNMSFAPDAQLATDISAARSSLSPSLHSAFDEKVQTAILNRIGQNGTLSGDALKNAESELSSFATNYSKSPTASEREVGMALKTTRNAFRDALERQNPDYAPLLQATNQGYANLKIAQKAAARDINGGVFSPAQLQQVVRSQGGVTNFSRGNAGMQDLSQAGQNVLGGGYPDSGTAGRAMMGLAGAAALGHVNPMIPLGAGVAMLPYTPWGQKLAVAALTKRPNMARPIANMLRIPPAMTSAAFAPYAARSTQ